MKINLLLTLANEPMAKNRQITDFMMSEKISPQNAKTNW